MSDAVIDQEQAREWARRGRNYASSLRDMAVGSTEMQHNLAAMLDSIADALDPKPPTVRQQVAAAIARAATDFSGSGDYPDFVAVAALAAILDGWSDFADLHCFRSPGVTGYAIDTRRVGEWLRGVS